VVQNEKNNRLDTWRVIGWQHLRCDNTCTRFNGELMSKIRKSARDKDCTIRIPGICNFNSESVVHCHINTNYKGIGLKSPDLFGFRGCSSCHDVIDGRNQRSDFNKMELQIMAYQAMVETQYQLIQEGLINVK
jgi:hypothetical protein